MLRSRLNPTPPPAAALVVAEGYKFLSATAVPAWSQPHLYLAPGHRVGAVVGRQPTSGRPRTRRLSQVRLGWVGQPGESRLGGTLVDSSWSAAAVLRAPSSLSGGFVQLCSN